MYICCVVNYILLTSCERKQAPGCASHRLVLTHLTPVLGIYTWRHPACQSYWANVTHRIDLLKCSTLNNLMPFSLIVPIRRLKILFGWNESGSRNPQARPDSFNYIIFLSWKWSEFDLRCNNVLQDEINYLWQWWMTLVKRATGKCITNQLINSQFQCTYAFAAAFLVNTI